MRGRSPRLALLAALVSLLAAAPAATAHHELKMIWGPTTLPDGSSAFATYHHLGVDVFQIELQWDQVAPTEPQHPTDPADPAYRWPAAVDDAVREAKRYGIQVAIMLRGTPPWANGGRSASWAPDNPRDFARFARAASREYPSVRYWMIWGEPTRPGNFFPMPQNSRKGPRAYARILDAAYAQLKRQSHRNKVVGGMTWTLGLVPPADFVKWMRLPNGKPPRMDYYGHNPFSTRFPRLSQGTYYPGLRDMSDVDTMHAELAQVYRRCGHARCHTPKLWLSEFTVPSDHPNRAFDFSVSRRQQARWLTAAFRIAHRERYIEGIGWFNLIDQAGTGSDVLTEGLLTADGHRKPAYKAYRKAP